MAADKKWSADDYLDVQNRYEPQIRELEKKRTEAVELDANLGMHVKDAADVLRNLAKYYEKGGLKAK